MCFHFLFSFNDSLNRFIEACFVGKIVFTLFTFLFVNFEFSFSSIQTGDLNINFDPFCHDYDQGVLLF